MIVVEDLISKLQSSRKIFHSEDDFKLSFGLTIKELYPDSQIRLERPVEINMIDRNKKKSPARAPIDVVIIESNGHVIPIELKYKTKKTELLHNSEEYLLTNHGANDMGRYSFRKDIFRIEQYLTITENCSSGYVLIISNDKSYYSDDVSQKNNFDKFLSFHNGVKIPEIDKSWNYDNIDKNKYELKSTENKWKYKNLSKPHWTCTKEYFYQLDLNCEYDIIWNDFSVLEKTEFKYCLIKIDKGTFNNATRNAQN